MKKSFTNDITPAENPAMCYIKAETPTPCNETKSKRINLLFTPALKERAQAEAARRNISMNALICEILDGALK